MIKTFEEYMTDELAKPVPEFYSSDGSSSRAVVVRGLFKEVIYTYKNFPSRIVREIKCFDGWDTPIGWFISLLLVLLLAPVMPAIGGMFSHKRAVKDFKTEYGYYIKREGDKQ